MLTRSLIFYFFISGTLLGQSGLETLDAYIEAKNYVKAEELLKKQLQTSSSPNLKNKLGEVYGYQLKWDQAIDIYQELTSSFPQNASYFFRYGGVLAKKAQSSSPLMAWMYVGRIKRSFKTSLKLDPTSLETHWALVDLYVSLPGIAGGSNSQAYSYANKLKALSPLDGYLAIGYIHEYNDEPEKARSNYMKAFELLDTYRKNNRNQLNYQIGKICSDYQIQLDRGIKHMGIYIENYTVLDGVPLEWAYFRMAKLYRAKKNRNKAEQWIDKALLLKPDFKPALEERTLLADLQ